MGARAGITTEPLTINPRVVGSSPTRGAAVKRKPAQHPPCAFSVNRSVVLAHPTGGKDYVSAARLDEKPLLLEDRRLKRVICDGTLWGYGLGYAAGASGC
jgi:hypothetical protein